jgi:hypothetical protein
MNDRNSASSCSLKQSSWMIFICLTMANASASDPGVPVEPTTVRTAQCQRRPVESAERDTRTDQQDVVLLPFSNGTTFRLFLQLTVDLVGLGFCLPLCSPFRPPLFQGCEDIHRKGRGATLLEVSRKGKARTGNVAPCRPIGPKRSVVVMHDL